MSSCQNSTLAINAQLDVFTLVCWEYAYWMIPSTYGHSGCHLCRSPSTDGGASQSSPSTTWIRDFFWPELKVSCVEEMMPQRESRVQHSLCGWPGDKDWRWKWRGQGAGGYAKRAEHQLRCLHHTGYTVCLLQPQTLLTVHELFIYFPFQKFYTVHIFKPVVTISWQHSVLSPE